MDFTLLDELELTDHEILVLICRWWFIEDRMLSLKFLPFTKSTYHRTVNKLSYKIEKAWRRKVISGTVEKHRKEIIEEYFNNSSWESHT